MVTNVDNTISIQRRCGSEDYLYATVLKREMIPEGNEPKQRVRLSLGKHTIDMILRTLIEDTGPAVPQLVGFDRSNMNLAQSYTFAADVLRSRGMPIMPTTRMVSNDQVVVSDMMPKDGAIYDIKEQLLTRVFSGKRNGNDALLGTDQLLLQINDKELVRDVLDISERASNNAILLPEDSPYHVVINASGAWKIMILDISKMSIGFDNASLQEYLADYGSNITQYNTSVTERWVRSVALLKQHLIKLV